MNSPAAQSRRSVSSRETSLFDRKPRFVGSSRQRATEPLFSLYGHASWRSPAHALRSPRFPGPTTRKCLKPNRWDRRYVLWDALALPAPFVPGCIGQPPAAGRHPSRSEDRQSSTRTTEPLDDATSTPSPLLSSPTSPCEPQGASAALDDSCHTSSSASQRKETSRNRLPKSTSAPPATGLRPVPSASKGSGERCSTASHHTPWPGRIPCRRVTRRRSGSPSCRSGHKRLDQAGVLLNGKGPRNPSSRPSPRNRIAVSAPPVIPW
jgi:hypothetical protein